MTNSARNTIVLAILLILSGIASFMLLRTENAKLAAKKLETKEVLDQINNFSRMVDARDSLEEEYTRQAAMAGSQSKILLDKDNSIITYDYLIRVLKWLGVDIHYDFGMSDKAEGSYHEYVISGQTSYMDLVHFTRMLEYQRAVVTIEDISLSAENAYSDSVNFSMIFRTHYSEDGVPASEISYKTVDKPVAAYSLLRPRYTEDLQSYAEHDTRLVDIDNSTLIAISESRAFLRDARGIVRIVSVGERILWGYLQKIDYRENLAVFRVNKYGFEETQILYLNKEN